MKLKRELIKIAFFKLLPNLHDLILELELNEYVFGGEFNGENLKEFKILKSGKIKSRDVQRKKLDDWSDFIDVEEIREELKKNEVDYNDSGNYEINMLRTFMLMLSREVSILKLMVEDLKKEISCIEKNIDTDVVLKRLLTEKNL